MRRIVVALSCAALVTWTLTSWFDGSTSPSGAASGVVSPQLPEELEASPTAGHPDSGTELRPGAHPPDADARMPAGDCGSFEAEIVVRPPGLLSLDTGPLTVELRDELDRTTTLVLEESEWSGSLTGDALLLARAHLHGRGIRAVLEPPLSPDHPRASLAVLGFSELSIRPVEHETGHDIDEFALFGSRGLGDETSDDEWSPTVDDGEPDRRRTFEAPTRSVSVRVESPGFAPAWIRVGPYSGEVTVPMRRSGDLSVGLDVGELAPEKRPRIVHLSLTPLSTGPVPDRLLDPVHLPVMETAHFDGLAAGPYSLVVRGACDLTGVVLSIRRLDILPGEHSHVEVRLDKPPHEPATLEVTVSGIDPTHSVPEGLILQVQRRIEEGGWEWIGSIDLDDFQQLQGTSARFTRIEGLEPGAHRAHLRPTGLRQELQLTAGGATPILFEISDLVTHRIRVLGRDDAGSTKIVWGYADEAGSVAGTSRVHPDGTSRIECARRPIWAQAVSNWAASEIRTLPASERSGELDLSLDRSKAAQLALVPRADSGPPPTDFWKVKISPIGHEGRHDFTVFEDPAPAECMRSGYAKTPVVVLSSPGEYELRYLDSNGSWRAQRMTLRPGRNTTELEF